MRILGYSSAMSTPHNQRSTSLANNGATDTEYFHYSVDGNSAGMALRGDWTILNLGELEGLIAKLNLEKISARDIQFSCGGLQNFDLSGAWLLYRTAEGLKQRGFNTSYSGFRAEHVKFIEHALSLDKPTQPLPATPWLDLLGNKLTNSVSMALRESKNRYLWFIAVSAGLVATIVQPQKFRWIATARHVQDAGLSAIVIVALMAFLVSVVLGFQSQDQLTQFGAQIFTVDLVSISILREMGGLLTAILVAGRSGSAFAAEIGVMQLNEEVSAMETMGIDPFQALVIPRMVALIICLPLLTFVADIAGLVGTLFITVGLLDIPFNLVIERFLSLDPITHFKAGLIKAPFFALMIGSIGTYRGYYVQRSADAVGRNTTNAVVESIFMVIAVDAIFSIIFTELGW